MEESIRTRPSEDTLLGEVSKSYFPLGGTECLKGVGRKRAQHTPRTLAVTQSRSAEISCRQEIAVGSQQQWRPKHHFGDDLLAED